MEENRTLFELNQKYTIYEMSWMACTVKKEIKVVGFEDGNPIYTMARGRRRLKLMLVTRDYATAPYKPFSGMVFKGWDQPIKTDSETNKFRGNSCFNFLDCPSRIRAWIDANQLNPNFDKSRVLAVDNNNEETEIVVYPELVTPVNHAVLDRAMEKAKGV